MKSDNPQVQGQFCTINSEEFYKISNVDQIPSFFITLTSPYDYWMFITSKGGMTAGISNSGHSLFPYYTEDKLDDMNESTGSRTIVRVEKDGKILCWEPNSIRSEDRFSLTRNIYKNIAGNVLIMEEINEDLQLNYQCTFTSSAEYGIIKKSRLENLGQSSCKMDILDGMANIIPPGATVDLQDSMSNLLNAYKRNEADLESQLGLFTLNSILTDIAEPKESLRAHAVMLNGIKADAIMLSEEQVSPFRAGGTPQSEEVVRGKRSSFYGSFSLDLAAGASKEWAFNAFLDQTSADLKEVTKQIKGQDSNRLSLMDKSVETATEKLMKIMGINDGLQATNNEMNRAHHLSNSMFNVMRGGFFTNNYQIKKQDLLDFFKLQSPLNLPKVEELLNNEGAELSLGDLEKLNHSTDNSDIKRLLLEYLPITFSRRHGDPSRPWNAFNINTHNEDGSMRIDFQGNWRDIFQNWEALLFSYPGFTWNVINKFLNATSLDGYNPYRITLRGIDWECPEPDNPWASIGYWSDHQIIYLLKLLELQEKFYPGTLKQGLKAPITSSANIPYEIKDYQSILKDPQETIDFNYGKNDKIVEEAKERGNDARLVQTAAGDVYYVTPMEKLIVLLLAKLSNFIPDGGIWMNTQRPEWNDANNALVGYGISVVTLGYMRRYVHFLQNLLEGSDEFPVSREVIAWYKDIKEAFAQFSDTVKSGFNGKSRKSMVDALGEAATKYRKNLYGSAPSEKIDSLSGSEIKDFMELIQTFIDSSLENSRRKDGMFQSYNTLIISDDEMNVNYLYPMLEGQVSIISSGYLKAPEVNKVMESMKSSDLYRADQHSFILYPNRKMKSFFDKSIVPADLLKQFGLDSMDRKLQDIFFQEDREGMLHFNGDLTNAKDIYALVDSHGEELSSVWSKGTEDLKRTMGGLYEELFNHLEFTGRSGTFFAYEGLGSIYWHMVSKLMLALQEVQLESEDSDIQKQYEFVRDGIGYKRSVESYGAFPYDPYSHTPEGAGAKQPGMTGQVKEEVITRIAELGLTVDNGVINFKPSVIEGEEFFTEESAFNFYDASHQAQEIKVPANGLAFTYCAVPVLVKKTGSASLKLVLSNGDVKEQSNLSLDSAMSNEIFARSGKVSRLEIEF